MIRNIGCLLILAIVVALLLFAASVYHDMNTQTRMFVAGMVPPTIGLGLLVVVLLLVIVKLVTASAQREADIVNQIADQRMNGSGQAPAVVVMPGGSDVKQLAPGYPQYPSEHMFPTEAPAARRLRALGQ